MGQPLLVCFSPRPLVGEPLLTEASSVVCPWPPPLPLILPIPSLIPSLKFPIPSPLTRAPFNVDYVTASHDIISYSFFLMRFLQPLRNLILAPALAQSPSALYRG